MVGKVNDDGTYAIDYDDGDKEPSVTPELIRLLDDPAAAGAGAAAALGDVKQPSRPARRESSSRPGSARSAKGVAISLLKHSKFTVLFDFSDDCII